MPTTIVAAGMDHITSRGDPADGRRNELEREVAVAHWFCVGWVVVDFGADGSTLGAVELRAGVVSICLIK